MMNELYMYIVYVSYICKEYTRNKAINPKSETKYY